MHTQEMSNVQGYDISNVAKGNRIWMIHSTSIIRVTCKTD